MSEQLNSILDHLDRYLGGFATEIELRQNTAQLFAEMDKGFSSSAAGAYAEFKTSFETLVESKRRNPGARSFNAGLASLRRRGESITTKAQIAEQDAQRENERRERELRREPQATFDS